MFGKFNKKYSLSYRGIILLFVIGLCAGFWTCAILFFDSLVSAKEFSPVERPPIEYRLTEEQMDPSKETRIPLRQLQDICPKKEPIRNYSGQIQYQVSVVGCYNSLTDKLYIPSDWASKKELFFIREHEWAHKVFKWKHK